MCSDYCTYKNVTQPLIALEIGFAITRPGDDNLFYLGGPGSGSGPKLTILEFPTRKEANYFQTNSLLFLGISEDNIFPLLPQ